MLCYATVDQSFDVPYWIAKNDFSVYFDQIDFAFRDVHDVHPAYLSDWFHVDEQGRLRFRLSPVGAVAGKTQFISGRHRMAVILPHLTDLPIAFAFHKYLPKRERRLLESIPKRPLDMTVPLELPDFPIRDRLP